MPVLMISPSPPMPIGPAIRAYYTVQALAREHEVDIICGDFDSILGSILSADEVRERLQRGCPGVRQFWLVPFSRAVGWARLAVGWLRGTPMRIAFCSTRLFAREFRRRLSERRYDLIWVNFGRMEPFARGCGLPTIVDMHDSMSLRHATFAEVDAGRVGRLIHRIESRRESEHEAHLIRTGYQLVVSATSDANHLIRNGAAPSQITVLPNVIEWEELEKSQDDPSLASSLLFSGNMRYFPNQDALRFFHDQILPRVLAGNPQATFLVVGSKPPAWARRFARDQRIRVTGFVPDLGAYIKQAKVVVAPLRCGSGTSVKVLQAMALRRAVVATPYGARGLDVEHDKHLLIARTPEEFAGCVNLLLADEARRKRLGEAACELVRSRYSPAAIYEGALEIVRAASTRSREAILVGTASAEQDDSSFQ